MNQNFNGQPPRDQNGPYPYQQFQEQNGQFPYMQSPQPDANRSDKPWNIFAVLGLVIGIISFVLTFFFLFAFLAVFAASTDARRGAYFSVLTFGTLISSCSVHGIIFSALGRKSKTSSGKATTGLVFSIIACALSLLLVFIFALVIGTSVSTPFYFI